MNEARRERVHDSIGDTGMPSACVAVTATSRLHIRKSPAYAVLSREPRAESREPRAESREPRAESREPRAESREPRAESREPRAESREPRAESREPRAESRAASADRMARCGTHHIHARAADAMGRADDAWRECGSRRQSGSAHALACRLRPAAGPDSFPASRGFLARTRRLARTAACLLGLAGGFLALALAAPAAAQTSVTLVSNHRENRIRYSSSSIPTADYGPGVYDRQQCQTATSPDERDRRARPDFLASAVRVDRASG